MKLFLDWLALAILTLPAFSTIGMIGYGIYSMWGDGGGYILGGMLAMTAIVWALDRFDRGE